MIQLIYKIDIVLYAATNSITVTSLCAISKYGKETIAKFQKQCYDDTINETKEIDIKLLHLLKTGYEYIQQRNAHRSVGTYRLSRLV